jgi:hypothetical protein
MISDQSGLAPISGVCGNCGAPHAPRGPRYIQVDGRRERSLSACQAEASGDDWHEGGGLWGETGVRSRQIEEFETYHMALLGHHDLGGHGNCGEGTALLCRGRKRYLYLAHRTAP